MGTNSIVDYIGLTFGLSVSQLEEVCQIQRESGIESNTMLSKQTAYRLFKLRVIANQWNESGYDVPSSSDMTKPRVNGMSLYDALSNDIVDEELILFIGSRIYLMCSHVRRVDDPFE